MTTKQFIENLPSQVNHEALENHHTVFHFDIEGGGKYTVKVEDGKLETKEGLEGTPKCVVQGSEDNFIGLVNGSLNPMMALLTGKIKISNQGEMLKYAKKFGLM